MKVGLRVALALFVASTASCMEGIVGCKASLAISVHGTVVYAITGAPAIEGATVVIRGSNFADSVVATSRPSPLDSVPIFWTEDRIRPGDYAITVRKAGYRDWA